MSLSIDLLGADLFLKLSDSERVTWNGRFRPTAEQLSNFTAAGGQVANLARFHG